MNRNTDVENKIKEQFVGKTEEVFLTQFAYDLKLEELKTASNPDNKEVKITIHAYGNDKEQLVKDVKEIYKSALGIKK